MTLGGGRFEPGRTFGGLVAEILDRVVDPGRLMHLDGVPDGYWVVLALADLEAARSFAHRPPSR